ncbi:MAG TPA: PqqD family protein [Crenotrichaceae bacterium]|nr:PqqD family protein [Crenotrichaceae bacterium]
MDGEIVMMSIENGHYFGSNAVGSFIWELIETEQTIKAICTAVADHFNIINMSNLEKEITAYVEDLYAQKLLITC